MDDLMDGALDEKAEARIQEMASRHLDLVTRMKRIDDALARRTLAAVMRADPAMTFAQAAGEAAMLLRYAAEQRPRRDGDGAMRPMADLRPAMAYTLDLIGRRYPESERFRPRFRFALDGDAPPGPGPAALEFAAWQFERTFADRGGRLAPGFDAAMVERLAAAMNRPLPAEFFESIRTDIAMTSFGIQMYCSVSGENPTGRLAAVWRSFHPAAIESAEAGLRRAMQMVERVVSFEAEPSPASLTPA